MLTRKEQGRVVAWLIERGQAVNHVPTIWWKAGNTRTWPDREAGEDWLGKDWTLDVNEARKFSSPQEAEGIAFMLFGAALPKLHSITEHVFIGKAKATPEDQLSRLVAAVDEVMAVLGCHGEICARDDRVQAVMDLLHEIDPK